MHQRTKRDGYGPRAGRAPRVARRAVQRVLASGPSAREGGGARCTAVRSEERRKKTDKRRGRAPRVTRGACLTRRHLYARWRAAEERARSARGARTNDEKTMRRPTRHHHTPPRPPCSGVAARAASLQSTRVARVASRDTHGRDPLCAERRRKRDTAMAATDRKTWKT